MSTRRLAPAVGCALAASVGVSGREASACGCGAPFVCAAWVRARR